MNASNWDTVSVDSVDSDDSGDYEMPPLVLNNVNTISEAEKLIDHLAMYQNNTDKEAILTEMNALRTNLSKQLIKNPKTEGDINKNKEILKDIFKLVNASSPPFEGQKLAELLNFKNIQAMTKMELIRYQNIGNIVTPEPIGNYDKNGNLLSREELDATNFVDRVDMLGFTAGGGPSYKSLGNVLTSVIENGQTMVSVARAQEGHKIKYDAYDRAESN